MSRNLASLQRPCFNENFVKHNFLKVTGASRTPRIRTVQLALLGVLCLIFLGEMEAQQKSSRPGYQLLLQNEDWSAISESSPSDKSDFFDPMKYVALSESGSVWASFGGHYRVRNETWNNFGLSDTAGRDDNFTNTRLFMHADIHLGKYVRVFTEG